MEIVKAFLDDGAQLTGPYIDLDGAPEGRSERETEILRLVTEKARLVHSYGEVLGGVKPLGFWRALKERHIYLKKYSAKMEGSGKEALAAKLAAISMPEDAGEQEIALREKLCSIGMELVQEGLIQGSWGNISARVDENTMLVTPSGIDYDLLKPQHMVRVNIHTFEYDKNGPAPSSEAKMHGYIYAAGPDLAGIVHTHSPGCCAFASCEMDLNFAEARYFLEEEAQAAVDRAREIFGGTVRCAEFGYAGSDRLAENVRAALGSGLGVLMAHHGMAACGRSIEDAFEACRAMEAAAAAICRAGIKSAAAQNVL